MRAAIKLTNVVKNFGGVAAIDGVDLSILPGEFFAMLGPSGSGKTTCLRLVAGFERPTSGHIDIFGQSVEGVPPYRRNVNTVFQDYALFPHLNVFQNVAYGLKVRGMPARRRQREAEEALNMVKLAGYGARRPAQLSGGQRQRVALARAIVNKPGVLLLDEPLGALDLKLRLAMQDELKALQQTLGITFVFVTHDQSEALCMADRVAVFNEGRIMQVGKPTEIYRKPRSRFVADFVGSSNILPPEFTQRYLGRRAWASLRPESLGLSQPGADAEQALSGTNRTLCVAGICSAVNFQGASTRLTVDVDGLGLNVLLPASRPAPQVGAQVTLSFARAALHLMEDEVIKDQAP